MGTAPRRSAVPTPSLTTPPNQSSIPAVSPGDARPDKTALLGVLREAFVAGKHDPNSLLHAVADAARFLSGADGAAVAMRAGAGIVCSARSGDIAPDLGTPLNANAGISGECFRTGRTLVCHDAFSDPRVDPAVCRALGIRSIAAVPLRSSLGIAGILEAFSARPNAFDGEALSCLRELAEIAQTAEAPSAEPRPAESRLAESRLAVPRLAEPRLPERRRETPAHLAAFSTLPAAVSPASIQTIDMLVDESDGRESGMRSLRNHAWLIVGLVLALLLTVAVAWWSWSESPTETAVSAAPRSEAPSDPASARPALRVVAKPAPGLTEPFAAGKRTARSNRDTSLQNAAELQPEEVIVAAPSANSPSSPSSSSDSSTRSGVGKPAGDETASEPPPTLDVASLGNSKPLPELPSVRAPMPTLISRVSQGVTEPSLIRKVEPIYPAQARMRGVTGKVTLQATIAADGSIGDVSVVSGPDLLAKAATTALRQWRYHPALLNGSPVAIQKQVTFVFNLP